MVTVDYLLGMSSVCVVCVCVFVCVYMCVYVHACVSYLVLIPHCQRWLVRFVITLYHCYAYTLRWNGGSPGML